MSYIIAFLVSFVYIYLKAWQQINVMQKRYKAVPVVAILMALCEVTTVGLIVHTSLWLFIPIGIGGALGCLLSMWRNHR